MSRCTYVCETNRRLLQFFSVLQIHHRASRQMASNTKSKALFDSEEALMMVKELRVTFDCGKTRSYEWRISQLKAIIKLTEENEQQIYQALHSDLSKCETEAFVQEVLFFSLSKLEVLVEIYMLYVFLFLFFCSIYVLYVLLVPFQTSDQVVSFCSFDLNLARQVER